MSVRKVVRLWDVEGVPVVEVGFTDAGGGFIAVDSATPRLFPGDSAYRNGAIVPEDRFAELFPEAVPRIAAALSSTLLYANSEQLLSSEWSLNWGERFNGSKPLIDDPKLWAEAVAERDNDQQTPYPLRIPMPPQGAAAEPGQNTHPQPSPPRNSPPLPPDFGQRLAAGLRDALLRNVETP